MPKAESAAAKALELDGSLAEGHAALAGVRALYDWDWRGAEREFKRAMDLNPAYAEAHHLYATLYCAPLGRKQETIEHMELALKLDPLSPIITTDRGWAYFLAGQTDRAMAEYHAALYLDSSFAPAMDRLSQAYEQNGDFKDALWWNDQNAEYPNDVKTAMERAYSRAGYRGALQEQLEMMTKLVKSGAVEDPYSFAFVYAKLGENDRALEQLEKAYEERHPGMVYIKVDPPFETLRGNARFQSLERRVGLVP
jgi:Tfp pilus assembly protein PilF